jgi:hypothetical protein
MGRVIKPEGLIDVVSNGMCELILTKEKQKIKIKAATNNLIIFEQHNQKRLLTTIEAIKLLKQFLEQGYVIECKSLRNFEI